MTRPVQDDQAAFPGDENKYFDPELGLTKREYFAAAALQGLLANPNRVRSFDEYGPSAVLAADFLIDALNRTKP